MARAQGPLVLPVAPKPNLSRTFYAPGGGSSVLLYFVSLTPSAAFGASGRKGFKKTQVPARCGGPPGPRACFTILLERLMY